MSLSEGSVQTGSHATQRMWLRKGVSSLTYQSQTSQTHFGQGPSLLILGECKNYASVCEVETDTHQVFLFHQTRVTAKITAFNPTRALYFRDSVTKLSSVTTTYTCWHRSSMRLFRNWFSTDSKAKQLVNQSLPSILYLQQDWPKFSIIKHTEQSLICLKMRNMGFMKKTTSRL